jgi:putative FmdB family regulatory protein
MATYQIECEKCEIYWEVERSMDNPPKKGKCPQCGKMGNRCFTAPALHFIGAGFETNRARWEKYQKQGMDKDTANQFLNNSIKASKDNMKRGHQHYKQMVLDEDYAAKNNMIKKVDDKTKKARFEEAKKNQEHFVKKAYKK